jgi:thiamine-monophosphate kinase
MRETDIISLFFSRGAQDPKTSARNHASRLKSASEPESASESDLPRDDCARLDSATIVTTDSLAEGTHFRRDWSGPEDLAIKLWNVNVSDIAASGGDPEWCLLNLGLPSDTGDDWIREFAEALTAEVERDGGRLVGGDTYRSSLLTLTLTLAGKLPKNHDDSARPPARSAKQSNAHDAASHRYIDRRGARPDDAIYVTGAPGLSLLGYEILSGRRTRITKHGAHRALYQAAVERHLRPRARLAWSRTLRKNADLHSMMDLSDGLYADLLRLVEANPGLRYEIDCALLPLSDLRQERDVTPGDGGHPASPDEVRAALAACEITEDGWRELALASGEEFELLFSAPPGLRFEFPCTQIGRISADLEGPAGGPASERLRLLNAPIKQTPRWYQHF